MSNHNSSIGLVDTNAARFHSFHDSHVEITVFKYQKKKKINKKK